MSDSSYMDARQKTIAEILSDNNKLVIPIFQRDYSWKEENWKELWSDIKNGYEEKRYHYMGSVVLVENRGIKEIVDGQQRITTLSLLYLAIIKNFSYLIKDNINKEDNQKRIEDIRSNIIFKRDLYHLDRISNKLVLNETNNPIYQNYIVEDKVEELIDNKEYSNMQLIKCYKYFVDKIKKACTVGDNKYTNEDLLLNYYTYISSNIIFIQITATDYSNAYTIFETLNDRGLDLTVTDLLKNYMFSMINKEDHNDIQILWRKMCNNVGEKNVTKFLRHYWNSCHKKVTERDLFRAIKKEIEQYNGAEKENKVKSFIVNLEKMSVIYSAISDPYNEIWKNDKKLIEYLIDIKLYKVDLCYPVLLAVQLNVTDERLKQKLFRLCARISFRYIIISEGTPNDLEVAYNNLCLKICSKKNELNYEEVVIESSKFIVSKEKFIIAFKNKVIKTKNNKRIITYILNGIEKNMGGVINDNYTIEHILPENPEADKWIDIFDRQQAQYIYRLGNYTLLEKETNSIIGNKIYDEKISAYKSSNSIMTKQVALLEEWNIKYLKERQEKMAKIAEAVWGL